MPRIAGVDIPAQKRVEIALQYIYGIGPNLSKQILSLSKVSPETRAKDLTEEEISKLRDLIEKRFRVEGELKKEIDLNIKRLVEIGSYRGLRHRRGLPVRGQRTRTNARTRRGVRRTVAGRGKRRGVAKK